MPQVTGPLIIAGPSATASALNITAATLLKAGRGYIVRISVIVAGTAGTINDAATVGAAATANEIGAIPATVGVVPFEFPYFAGLVITPGAGQTVSVAYS